MPPKGAARIIVAHSHDYPATAGWILVSLAPPSIPPYRQQSVDCYLCNETSFPNGKVRADQDFLVLVMADEMAVNAGYTQRVPLNLSTSWLGASKQQNSLNEAKPLIWWDLGSSISPIVWRLPINVLLESDGGWRYKSRRATSLQCTQNREDDLLPAV